MRVYVGYDRREDLAWRVCRYSIRKHSPNAKVIPIVQDYLRAHSLYTRDPDILAATDFSVTRYLVPYLANYDGLAVYCDLDFLFTTDVENLTSYATKADKAVYCRQHDYAPKTSNKMWGRKQISYPRKNWASMMLFDCSHKDCRNLTPKLVNSAKIPYLNEFQWTNDIAKLSDKWNFLVGEYEPPELGALSLTIPTSNTPYALHYTRGGLWLEEHEVQDYDALWNEYYSEMITEEANST